MRTCEQCGGEIPKERLRSTVRFCSNVCRTTAWREANPEKVNEAKEKYRQTRRDGYIPKTTRAVVDHAGVKVTRTGNAGTPDCLVLLQLSPGAVLELSQEEALTFGGRLRHIGYNSPVEDPPRKQILPRVFVESNRAENVVRIEIAGTPVAIDLTVRDAALIGNQLTYHGRTGIPPKWKHNSELEAADEDLLEEIMRDKRRPYTGKIPVGQKASYIKELRRSGWKINDIMKRLKASGKTVREALDELA